MADQQITNSAPMSTGTFSGNAFVVGMASALVRVAGLIREIVFAALFGATGGIAADCYNVAFRVAQFFRELVAEGSLSNIFVPVFTDVIDREGMNGAWQVANAFLGMLLFALGIITLLTFSFADGWVWLLAGGFSEDPEKFSLAVRLTRIFSPFVATMSLSCVFMGMM